MQHVTCRRFTPAGAPRLVELQGRCLRMCADIRLIEAGFYYAPTFEQGQNILCAEEYSPPSIHRTACWGT